MASDPHSETSKVTLSEAQCVWIVGQNRAGPTFAILRTSQAHVPISRSRTSVAHHSEPVPGLGGGLKE
jgi:hypothetical protein